MMAGSGNSDYNGFQGLYFRMANEIAKNGIAVFRYNKRIAQYGAESLPLDYDLNDEYVEDLGNAVATLQATELVDCKQIYVAGHSLGGYVIPQANQVVEGVDGYIMLSAPARPVIDLYQEQIEYLVNLDGEVTEQEAQMQEATNVDIAIIRNPGDLADDTIVLGYYLLYWVTQNSYDPLSLATEIEVPVLVIQGGRDYQVTVEEYELWQQVKNNDLWTYKYYDTLSHIYNEGGEPPSPVDYHTVDLDTTVTDDIANWILEN